MLKAVIIAGGRGKRLGEITREIPKPMIKVGDKSILEHQITLLKRYGIKEIIILTAYLADVIEKYFRNGEKFGVNISFLRSAESLGNADRIKLAQNFLTDDFIVFYGDVMLDMDLKKLFDFHKTKVGVSTLVIHPNDHPFDSDLIETDANNKIVAIHPKPHSPDRYFKNLVNAGVYVMSPSIFEYLKAKSSVELDFGKHIFPKLIKEKIAIYGYATPEYLKDMGTPERLKQVNKDFLSGKIGKFNLRNKQKAVFLDRDGVINYDSGNLADINKFYLLPRTTKAIKLINDSDFLAIVATNQPVVAKGLTTIKDVERINKKMETLLGMQGAKLDGVYFCPHHPERGYPDENKKYTIQCECRKPQIGMLKKAEKFFNIDLRHSWFVGDSERDIIAGKNAGTKTVLVKKNQKNFEKCRVETKKAKDLYSAVKFILNQK